MIKKNEIYYDKRTHRVYIASIVDEQFAFLKYTTLEDIKHRGCFVNHHHGINKKDKVVITDINKLRKTTDEGGTMMDNPMWKIGIKEEGNCGNTFFETGAFERIAELRAKDNWTGEPAEAFTGDSNERAKVDKGLDILLAKKKPIKKKKKPIKKTIVGNKTHVIPVPKHYPKIDKTPIAMQPISNKAPDVKAVPKKVTKKAIVKKPKNK